MISDNLILLKANIFSCSITVINSDSSNKYQSIYIDDISFYFIIKELEIV